MAQWYIWRRFPDPRSHGVLIAPFGAGCYELRLAGTRARVLFGSGGHVALRMTSLLPKPLGSGTRHNSEKRRFILEHIHRIEYRTIPCADVVDARKLESELKLKRAAYHFRT